MAVEQPSPAVAHPWLFTVVAGSRGNQGRHGPDPPAGLGKSSCLHPLCQIAPPLASIPQFSFSLTSQPLGSLFFSFVLSYFFFF